MIRRRHYDEMYAGLSEPMAVPMRGRSLVTAPSYVGPLDLIGSGTVLQAVSARRQLRSAYAGPLARLRESGANTEQDFSPAAGLWPAATAASFIGANSGFYAKLYDQSGNGFDPAQGTTARQPGYAAAGLSGGAALSFDGVNDSLDYNFSPQIAATDAWALIVAARGTLVQYHALYSFSTDGFYAWHGAGGGELFINAGTFLLNTNGGSASRPTPSTNVPFYASVRTTTGKVFGVNGSEAGATGTGSWAIDRMSLGGRLGPSGALGPDVWIGHIVEAYFFTVAPGSGDRAALIADVVSFYGLS